MPSVEASSGTRRRSSFNGTIGAVCTITLRRRRHTIATRWAFAFRLSSCRRMPSAITFRTCNTKRLAYCVSPRSFGDCSGLPTPIGARTHPRKTVSISIKNRSNTSPSTRRSRQSFSCTSSATIISLRTTNRSPLMRSFARSMTCVAIALTSGCSNALTTSSVVPPGPAPEFSSPIERAFGGGAIQHIVVIVQENRTVDNLFNGFPGADTVTWGRNENGQAVVLHRTPLAAQYDMSHKHETWLTDYARGKMDGFSDEGENCYAPSDRCPASAIAPYGYVPRGDVKPYWDMAQQYTFADRMFQSNQGPSFPAHQYIISGTSTIADGSHYRAEENATAPHSPGHQGGCSSAPDATVQTIDDAGKQGPTVFPCFDRNSIMHEMDLRHVTWRYFQQFGGSGQWHAVNAVRNVWDGPTY